MISFKYTLPGGILNCVECDDPPKEILKKASNGEHTYGLVSYMNTSYYAAYALKLLDENEKLKNELEKAIQTNKHCVHVIGKITSPPGLTELTDYLSKNTSATIGAETCIEALKIIKNLQELVNEKVTEISQLKIKLSNVNRFLKHIKEGVSYYL